jgi:outer membrane protein
MVALALSPALAWAENLAELYELAHQHDAKWQGAILTRDIAKEAERQALGRLLPSLNAEGSYTDSRHNINQQEVNSSSTSASGFEDISLDNHQALHEGTWDVNLSQSIYDPAEWYAYQASKSASEQANAQMAFEEQELMVRVEERYIDVLRAEDDLRTSQEAESTYLGQQKESEARENKGIASVTDVDQAEAAYEGSVAQRITDAGNWRAALAALTVLTGQEHESVWLLAKDFPVRAPEPADVNAWLDSAKTGNFQVKAATLAMQAAGENIQSKSAAYVPRVTASLVYQEDHITGHQDVTPYSPFLTPPAMSSHTGMAVIKATLPFDISGAISSGKRQASDQYALSRDQLEDALRNVLLETRKRWIAASSDVERVHARQHASDAAARAVIAVRTGYGHGIHSMADVLTSERQHFAAKRELANAQYDYIVDVIHLKEQTGQLNPQDLLEINQWLEKPAANTRAASE